MNLATNTATVEFDAARIRVGDFVARHRRPGLRRAGNRAARQTRARPALPAAPDRGRAVRGAGDRVWGWRTGRRGSNWPSPLPVIFYSGAPFYLAAWSALRHVARQHEHADFAGHRRGFLYSVYETVRGGHEVYYEAAAIIIALILLGRTLEARARARLRAAIRRLMDLQPPTARVLRDGAEVEIRRGGSAPRRHGGGAAGRAHPGGWHGARTAIRRWTNPCSPAKACR